MRSSGRLSLRTRLTLAATLVAAAGLAIGGVIMIVALERALLGALDETARAHGRDVATLVESDQVTNPMPSFGASVIQVVDADGRVLASTPGGDRLVPIVAGDDLDAIRAGEAVNLDGTRLGRPERLRVVGVEADPPDGPVTVVVAVSLAEQQRSTDIATKVLIAGAVVLTGALAALSWVVIGRALRPVDELRGGAEVITGQGGARRLPVPGGDDELTRLATTLNDMLARLDAASERQRAFVADAAHELRSPITALRTQLEVAMVHPGAADPHDIMSEALTEVERMARLVDDLLVLAQLDDPRPVRAEQEVDLREIVADVVAARRNPRVQMLVEPGQPAAVRADADALRRAVRNLVDNAERHAATKVTIEVRPTGHQVRVVVTDDGPGVPEADRTRIFERFTRLDDARDRDAGGSGLGLAIAREIVQAHRGSVIVEDAAPGARFVVSLPTGPGTGR